jgi:hypothetical protein
LPLGRRGAGKEGDGKKKKKKGRRKGRGGSQCNEE